MLQRQKPGTVVRQRDLNHSSFLPLIISQVSQASHGTGLDDTRARMRNSAVIHDAGNERNLELPLDYLQDVTKNIFVLIGTNTLDGRFFFRGLVITPGDVGYEEGLNLAGVRDLMARREENESAETDTV